MVPLCALTSSRLDPLRITHYSLISVFISLPAKIIHHGREFVINFVYARGEDFHIKETGIIKTKSSHMCCVIILIRSTAKIWVVVPQTLFYRNQWWCRETLAIFSS